MKVKKAVILAAGLGTRMLPATKSVPKELIPIVDKPALQYLVEERNRGHHDRYFERQDAYRRSF